jgi:hypothetical protein
MFWKNIWGCWQWWELRGVKLLWLLKIESGLGSEIGRIDFFHKLVKKFCSNFVAQAIPTYKMSIFLLPMTLLGEINAMMQWYWWGHCEKETKVHLMKWERIGRSKQQGGIGFRDLKSFNKALLAKYCLRILKNHESLSARILKAKYIPSGFILDAPLGRHPSYIWISILSARDLLSKGLNGRHIRIWKDQWVP